MAVKQSDVPQIAQQVGVDLSRSSAESASNLTAQIAAWNDQNASPGDILAATRGIPGTVGGIPGIGSSIPQIGRIPLPTAEIPNILGPLNQINLGVAGTWEATHYANDLNAHHPKFKFLFKVEFQGFTAKNFYRYVHRIDKPKVRFNHQDMNYYNFRTRVLTHMTFEPLAITFLDEIGNSVNNFFATYMAERSGQGEGHADTDAGLGKATSTKSYPNGYSAGRKIIVEQIFANGTHSNWFTFINPRIEAFDFDELNMEDSLGSLLTVMFSYDALTCDTHERSRLYGWGETDLLKGGDYPGKNAGDESGMYRAGAISATGKPTGREVKPPTTSSNYAAPDLGEYPDEATQSAALEGLTAPTYEGPNPEGAPAWVSENSTDTIINRNVQETFTSVRSGLNLNPLLGITVK